MFKIHTIASPEEGKLATQVSKLLKRERGIMKGYKTHYTQGLNEYGKMQFTCFIEITYKRS